MEGFTPVKGKCTFWREAPDADDMYDTSIRKPEKRIRCSCFVEGHGWTFPLGELPRDCPNALTCRYYIKCA